MWGGPRQYSQCLNCLIYISNIDQYHPLSINYYPGYSSTWVISVLFLYSRNIILDHNRPITTHHPGSISILSLYPQNIILGHHHPGSISVLSLYPQILSWVTTDRLWPWIIIILGHNWNQWRPSTISGDKTYRLITTQDCHHPGSISVLSICKISSWVVIRIIIILGRNRNQLRPS